MHRCKHSLLLFGSLLVFLVASPSPPPHFLSVFRWPFGRRANKTRETPPFLQTDTHTYLSPISIASTLTSPTDSSLSVNEDPPPTHLHSTLHIRTHTHTHTHTRCQTVDVTANALASLDPPLPKSHTSYETHTSAPPAFLSLCRLNTHVRPPPAYRTIKTIQPPPTTTIRTPKHVHFQEMPGAPPSPFWVVSHLERTHTHIHEMLLSQLHSFRNQTISRIRTYVL